MIIDKLMDFFSQDDKLMIEDGGQKVDLWESAAKTAKDTYYQTLFSGGEKLMPTIEKVLGAEAPHEAELLLRYLSGSGESVPLSEDQNIIDKYLQTVHSAAEEWKPTTNRELNPNTGISYADEGWEFTQVKPSQVLSKMGIDTFTKGGDLAGSGTTSKEWNDLYDKLGTDSSVRRRELEGGGYEYMIVEPWDLIKGTGGEASYPGEFMSFTEGGWGRRVPETMAFFQKFAPDFLSTRETEEGATRMELNLSDYGKDWLENKAKPFNITGSSIINK